MDDREKAVYSAALADQAERYDEMLEIMKDVAKMGVELSPEEWSLLSVAYKRATGPRRASWRTLTAIEDKEESSRDEPNFERLKGYREKVETEITDICRDILSILDQHLVPSITTPDAAVFYYKTKGDCYRYLAELKNGTDKQEAADESLKAYEAATHTAEVELLPTDLVRLGLAVNLSVLHYGIFNSPQSAMHVAKRAFDEAILGLDGLSEEGRKDCVGTLHLLQDNIRIWHSELPEDAGVDVGNTTKLIFD